MENITGTLVWYYYICPREVWLIAHEINPDQDNALIEMGRLIHEDSYLRDRKGLETVGMKIDLIKETNGKILVGEIKKSSRFLKSATMQMAYYIWRLKETGVIASGVVLIPKQKKRIKVELNEEIEAELKCAFAEIMKIVSAEKPPEPKKICYCRKCAYMEFCWV